LRKQQGDQEILHFCVFFRTEGFHLNLFSGNKEIRLRKLLDPALFKLPLIAYDFLARLLFPCTLSCGTAGLCTAIFCPEEVSMCGQEIHAGAGGTL